MIPDGTNVTVSIIAANHNPEIWGEDAHEWKPKGWLSPLPDSMNHRNIPGVYSNMSAYEQFSL